MSTTQTGFLHRGTNVIDTLQPDHAHSLAARVRELEAALEEMESLSHNCIKRNQPPEWESVIYVVRDTARRALKGGAA